MTHIELLEHNLQVFEQQLRDLNKLKTQQVEMFNQLEQLEQKLQAQVAELKAYLANASKEFVPMEPIIEAMPEVLPAPVAEETKIAEEIVEEAFEEILPEAPKATVIEPEIVIVPPVEQPKAAVVNKENLNEKLAKVRKESTVEKLSQTKIEDLKKALTLNQRLAYAKSFFGGDGAQFTVFIDALNICGSVDAAKSIIESQIDAAKNEELYEELTHLVQRRWQ